MNIFDGISEKELKDLFNCISPLKRSYLAGELIYDTQDKINYVGYIEEGSIQLLKDDYEGNKLIVANLNSGETFGEAFIFSDMEQSRLCVLAKENTRVIFLDYRKLFMYCSHACTFHKKLVENIVKIMSGRILLLQTRLELLSKKTLRERILYLLKEEKENHNKQIFEIPYSREQMAEYIGADRSALSRELSKMKADGLIDYHKNSFKILKQEVYNE